MEILLKSEIKNFSASQVVTFLDCNRKWFFQKILGIKTPPSEKMRLGTAIHKGLEQFVETGQYDHEQIVDGNTYNVHYYVEAAKPHLPPGPYIVEQKISLETETGIPWIGYVDLTTHEQITDYKTTSNLRYAKTPLELETNAQMVSYAKHYFENHPESDQVILLHIYIETKNKRKINTHTSQTTVTREHIEEQWSLIQEILENMVSIAKLEKWEEVPANPPSCPKYGGCPFIDKCEIDPWDQITHGIKKPTKSLASLKEPEPFTLSSIKCSNK